ncbi:MAG: sulfite exporter TauE/SafE family protein [Endomicrobium sp.]|nr:sulfite exporter TauE/SafE family protein [Endomicrobium sp.]
MEIITCIAIGVAGGFLSGLMGVGGASILTTLMLFFLKMTQQQAQGTCLAVICLSFFSVLVYYKKGHVNLNVAALVGVGFILGGIVGSYLAGAMPEQILKKCFAVYLITVAVKIFFSK